MNTASVSSTRPALEVTVHNHPGVLSHIAGLFARRGYNLESVFCMPTGDGGRSRIWLRVNDGTRLQQMMKQIEKLEDVLEVTSHPNGHEMFEEMAHYFR